MVPASVALALGVVVGSPLVTLEGHFLEILQLAVLVRLPGVGVGLSLLCWLHRKEVQATGMGLLRVLRVHPLGARTADHGALLPAALQRGSTEAGAPGQVGQGTQHEEARSSAAAHDARQGPLNKQSKAKNLQIKRSCLSATHLSVQLLRLTTRIPEMSGPIRRDQWPRGLPVSAHVRLQGSAIQPVSCQRGTPLYKWL